VTSDSPIKSVVIDEPILLLKLFLCVFCTLVLMLMLACHLMQGDIEADRHEVIEVTLVHHTDHGRHPLDSDLGKLTVERNMW